MTNTSVPITHTYQICHFNSDLFSKKNIGQIAIQDFLSLLFLFCLEVSTLPKLAYILSVHILILYHICVHLYPIDST